MLHLYFYFYSFAVNNKNDKCKEGPDLHEKSHSVDFIINQIWHTNGLLYSLYLHHLVAILANTIKFQNLPNGHKSLKFKFLGEFSEFDKVMQILFQGVDIRFTGRKEKVSLTPV